MKPKISIIVPVYNVSKYIERCLNSLIKQTLEDIEIVIVNDGSTDNSLEICLEYAKRDSRIKIHSKSNEGLGLTRNYGIKNATGEFLAFVDSDDYVSEDMCEVLYKRAIELNADIVYGNVYLDNYGRVSKKECIQNTICWKGKKEIYELLLDLISMSPEERKDTIMEVSVWKALFKKEILDNHNILFESEREYISEDVIFNIEVLNVVNIVVAIENYVYYYCYNGDSLSKKYNENRFKKEIILYHEVKNRLRKLGIDKNIVDLRAGRLLISRARVDSFQIIKSNESNRKKRELLLEICNNKDYRNVLSFYSVNKLPFKYSIIIYMHKYRLLFLLKILTYLGKRG